VSTGYLQLITPTFHMSKSRRSIIVRVTSASNHHHLSFSCSIPHYLDSSSIKREAETNDFLKISNLKKINTALDDFFRNELGFSSDVEVDASAIVRDRDEEELIKMLQLILGTAIECENKVQYIESIMQLDSASQRVLMDVIQDVMATHQKQRGNSTSHDRSLDTSTTSHNAGPSSADYDKLEQDYSALAAENAQLLTEKEHLVLVITQLEDSLNKKSATPAVEKKNNEADSIELSKKNAENEKLMSDNHRLHQEIDQREDSIADLRKKLEEVSRMAAEARSLRDEVDLLKEKAASVEDLEDRLKKTKKKADTVDDLKKQLKAVEEQSEIYLKKTLDLEETAKKANTYKSQVDAYKEQIVNLTAETKSLKINEEKRETQIQNLQKQTNDFNEQLKRKQSSIESLQKEIETIRQNSEENMLESHISGNDSMMVGLGVTDLNVKEKLMRLEAENKRLKEGGGGSDQVSVLENKIDDLERLVNKYSKHNEELKQRLSEQNDNGGEVDSAELAQLRDLNRRITEEQVGSNYIIIDVQCIYPS